LSEKFFYNPNDENEAQDYLNQYHPKTDINEIDSVEHTSIATTIINQPMGEADFTPKTNEINIDKSKFHLNLEYGELDNDLTQNDLDSGISIEQPSNVLSKVVSSLGSNFHQLNKLILAKDGVDDQINLQGILPSGYRIIFNEDNETNAAGACLPEHRVIILHNNPITISSILTLLHEVGHAWDFERISLDQLRQYAKKIDGRESVSDANRIKMERNAYAYILKEMKSFMDKERVDGELSFTAEDIRTAIDIKLAKNFDKLNH